MLSCLLMSAVQGRGSQGTYRAFSGAGSSCPGLISHCYCHLLFFRIQANSFLICILVIAGVFWIHRLVKFIYNICCYWEIHSFYINALRIPMVSRWDKGYTWYMKWEVFCCAVRSSSSSLLSGASFSERLAMIAQSSASAFPRLCDCMVFFPASSPAASLLLVTHFAQPVSLCAGTCICHLLLHMFSLLWWPFL